VSYSEGMRVPIALSLLLIGAVAGCAKGDDEARRVPRPPPPPGAELPDSLNIPINLDGRPVPPVDKKRLEALKPDFSAEERRAWKLTSVLGAAAQRPGVVIEARGQRGASITLRPPASDSEPQPVLLLTRRGELAAAMINPAEPFPDYHGRGGRLQRSGDPLPRVSPVALLRVFVERRGGTGGGQGGGRGATGAVGAVAVRGISIAVDGKPWSEWPAAFGDLPTVQVVADGQQRAAWPVRAIAERIGAGARLVKVIGEKGAVEIEAAAWADAARGPTLRTNRRGTDVKFQWSDANGVSDKSTEVRGVSGIELVTK